MEAKTTQEDVTRWRYLKGNNSQEDQQNKLSSKKTSLSDERLFDIGISYADPGNSTKDYNKSITTFKKLVTEYPNSVWIYRGHVIIGDSAGKCKIKETGNGPFAGKCKIKETGNGPFAGKCKIKRDH